MVAASYYPRRVNLRVPLCQYAAEVNLGAPYVCNFGAPIALSTNYFAAAVLSTTGVALTLSVAAGTILLNGLVPGTSASTPTLWGRGLTFVGDGASTRSITVTFYDYLGQRCTWTGTLNGTTAVPMPKTCMWLDTVVFGAAADTVSVSIGYNNVFGLPFKGMQMTNEVKNEAAAANAGTFVAGLLTTTTPTATNADPRGSYLPSTVLPDGTNTFMITYIPDFANLHGSAQYAA